MHLLFFGGADVTKEQAAVYLRQSESRAVSSGERVYRIYGGVWQVLTAHGSTWHTTDAVPFDGVFRAVPGGLGRKEG